MPGNVIWRPVMVGHAVHQMTPPPLMWWLAMVMVAAAPLALMVVMLLAPAPAQTQVARVASTILMLAPTPWHVLPTAMAAIRATAVAPPPVTLRSPSTGSPLQTPPHRWPRPCKARVKGLFPNQCLAPTPRNTVATVCKLATRTMSTP